MFQRLLGVLKVLISFFVHLYTWHQHCMQLDVAAACTNLHIRPCSSSICSMHRLAVYRASLVVLRKAKKNRL